jgi:hypothetical protein
MPNSICKNHKTKNYKGGENTPLGKGYHAEGEKVDKKMKGKDGNMYKVVKIKGEKKRWQKVKVLKRTKRGDPSPVEWVLLAEGQYQGDPDIYLKKDQNWDNKDSVRVLFDNNNEIIIPPFTGMKFEANREKYIYDVFNHEVKNTKP